MEKSIRKAKIKAVNLLSILIPPKVY
jgi:hypothetical protein